MILCICTFTQKFTQCDFSTPQVKLDETQLTEQEALRKQLQQEQELLQTFQESQEAKLLAQHEREKKALDEKVEASKRELEKQVCVCACTWVCLCVTFTSFPLRSLRRVLSYRTCGWNDRKSSKRDI